MAAQHLLELQDLDTQLDLLALRRGRLPEATERDRCAQALAESHVAAAAAQSRIDDAVRRIEDAERRGKELTAKRSRLEAQLKTVISPREAEALMNEIATLTARRGELDDAELLALDEQAAAESDLAAVLGGVPQLEALLRAAEATLAAVVESLDEEVNTLRGRRTEVLAGFPPGDEATYERARQRFGGVGVVRLQGTHCSGCHLGLSAAELDAVKADGERSECPQCGRIMVR